MISVSGLGKHYGDQTLFEGVSLQFNPGQRYGIVGANGCGKSTLLKILSREESASEGAVSISRRATLGVLKQDHFQYESQRILDVVMMGNAPLWEAMAEKERILARAEEHFDGDRYAELEDIILRGDGYTLESRAGEILEGLGIATEAHDQPLSSLSGGFKLRVLLAPPRHPVDPLAREVSRGVPGHRAAGLPRSPLPRQCRDHHRGHRLRHGEGLPGQLPGLHAGQAGGA
jgi:ATPase subunit of ABC transporter with duplicated ATPase domains